MKRILIDTNIYSAFKRNILEVTETLRRVDSWRIRPSRHFLLGVPGGMQ